MPWTLDEMAKLVDSYRTESDDAHSRMRADFRTFHDQTDTSLELLRDGVNTLRARVDLLERTPPDVAKLRFSTGVVVSIVFATATVVGAGYGFNAMIAGRIDALSRRLDEQASATAKLTDERTTQYQKSIEALTRRVELLQYEQQRLREDVTKQKGSIR